MLLYKNKGDIQNCNNYRSIKLIGHTMEVRERVVQMMMRRGVYLQKTIQIHVGGINCKDCPSCKEIVGAI